jgi:hypothetical protein
MKLILKRFAARLRSVIVIVNSQFSDDKLPNVEKLY